MKITNTKMHTVPQLSASPYRQVHSQVYHARTNSVQVISTAIEASSIQAFWVGTSFLLASTVLQPTWIALSHAFGRRPVLLSALVLFSLGSILCGVSHGVVLMLVGRVIQGAGVGGVLALTETIITDLIPLRQRGNYFAMIGVVWAVGTVAGPLLSGVLAQKDAWRSVQTSPAVPAKYNILLKIDARWIFYLNLPILGVGFIGVIMFLNLKASTGNLKQKLSQLDFIGSAIFIPSITSFLVPLTWGGVMYTWVCLPLSSAC